MGGAEIGGIHPRDTCLGRASLRSYPLTTRALLPEPSRKTQFASSATDRVSANPLPELHGRIPTDQEIASVTVDGS